MSLRLAFDATALLDARTGVGVFTHELLTRLARCPDLAVRAYAVTWRGRGRLGTLAPAGVTALQRPMAARPLRRAWLRSELPPLEWWSGRVDVVHGPNFVVPPTRRAATVVSVHDLTPWRFPQLANADTRAYPTLLRRAIERGAWVHTDSRFVAAEVVDRLGAPAERVVPIHLGVNELPAERRGADAATGHRLAGGDRYVLALGTVEPRKNLPLLVEAFDLLAGEEVDLRLVVAGADGWGAARFDEAVASARNRARIVRLGYVDDDQRAALLRGASVFAFPSVYEGFGLPPLEAMAAGVPVVCTDAGSLPEIVGDAAALTPADGLSRDALAAALAAVLDDRSRRDALVEAGRRRVQAFSWRRCTEQMVALYRRAAGEASTV